MRFVHFYFMGDDPGTVRESVSDHVEYWKGLNARDFQGGPFQDRSGGLILFSAESPEEAAAMVENDPFFKRGLLAESHLKEWLVQAAP